MSDPRMNDQPLREPSSRGTPRGARENMAAEPPRKLMKLDSPTEGRQPPWRIESLPMSERLPTAAYPERITDFAYFPPSWNESIASLAAAAEREDWTGNNRNENAILTNYITYTYQRLVMEFKIRITDDGNWAAFNTGLLTPGGDEIFGVFHGNANPGKQAWYLKGWLDESSYYIMNNFAHPLPEMANFVDPPANLVYDMNRVLTLSTLHILENIDRFPLHLQRNIVAAKAHLSFAKDMALKRLRRNYKLAVPQWYPGSGGLDVQLLLPLDLDQKGTPDLALVIAPVGAGYRGYTVLTLDMAYSNARVVARPDSEWLKP